MGSRLIPLLAARGHEVIALVRPSSERKLPAGCTPVLGDAFNGTTYAQHLAGCDSFEVRDACCLRYANRFERGLLVNGDELLGLDRTGMRNSHELDEMLKALADAVDQPAQGIKIVEVPAIRAAD